MKKESQYQRFTRSSLDGLAIFDNIQELLQWLILGYRPIYPAPKPGTPSSALNRQQRPAPIHWEALSQDDIRSVTVVLNTQLKLLAKVLPDLKSVELNDVSTQSRLSDIEVAQRVLSMQQALPKVLN